MYENSRCSRVEGWRGTFGLGSRWSGPFRESAGASIQTGPVDPAPALHTGHGHFLHPALPAEFAEKGYVALPLGLAVRATW